MMTRKKLVTAVVKSSNKIRFNRLTIIVISAALVFTALVAGCVQWTVSFHHKNGLTNDYEYGVVYELQQDVFIMASYSGICKTRGFLVPPSLARHGPSMLSGPPTIESWEMGLNSRGALNKKWAQSNGDTDTESVVGIVRRGVHIRFLHMIGHLSISLWYGFSRYDSPIAVINDGEYAGWIVDIIDISRWYPNKHMDSRFLRRVD